ncbi:MAG: His/Gly/Thr/Pro-type tRNA ligase C-terminal domain-containing protein, partial [Spirochaetota bacterium]|nr:His/Gly/Thr/Pro-type tRNA ligase C-terminal domain-containing protein [Spirochaetota bacterium]
VGWETIVRCGKCGYVANVETAQCGNDTDDSADSPAELEMVDTPNAKTISEVSKFLGADAKSFIKTLIYEKSDGKPVMVLIRGDLDVNEIKLANVLGESEVALPTDESVRSKLGLPVGYLGPVECGVDIPLLVDHSVKGIVNGVTGGNLADMHYKNVCVGRDFEVKDYVDLRLVGGGDRCVSCGTPLDSFKGMELGHVFKLGRKYTDAYNVTYLDESGKEQRPIMGTYGIGVNRIPAAVIENGHDGNGIVWPLSIAPYQVIVVPINWNDDKQRDAAVSIYEKLKERGVEVLLDDRDMRPGVKFKDADLIGIPIRINVGDKALAKDSVELKIRDKDGFDLVLKDDICDRVTEIIAEKLRALNEC